MEWWSINWPAAMEEVDRERVDWTVVDTGLTLPIECKIIHSHLIDDVYE